MLNNEGCARLCLSCGDGLVFLSLGRKALSCCRFSLMGWVDVLGWHSPLKWLLKHCLTSSSWGALIPSASYSFVRQGCSVLLIKWYLLSNSMPGEGDLLEARTIVVNLILVFKNMSQKWCDLKQVRCLFFKPRCHPGISLQAPSKGIKMLTLLTFFRIIFAERWGQSLDAKH